MLAAISIMAAVVLAGLIGAGTSTVGRTAHPAVSTCAPPYVFTLSQHTITAGDCAAVISAPRAPVTLTVGQRLTVAILRDAASAGAGFPVPTPTAPVLRLVAHRPGSAAYRAARAGSGRLIVRSRFCGRSGDRVRRCLVLRVRVR